MATNPPITIRIFTNVPAPGSGVTSAWAQTISQYLAPTAWVAMTPLTGGWANIGGGNPVAQYRKEGDVVRLRGAMNSGTIGSACFTLPAGFRPPNILHLAGGGGTYCDIVIDTAGLVTPSAGPTTAMWINVSFSTVA